MSEEKPKKAKKVGQKTPKAVEKEEKKPTTMVVTEEFLAEHPEIAEQGYKVGEEIVVENTDDQEEMGETPELGGPKKGSDVAIVKGSEFIRVYPKTTDSEAIIGFLSKDAKYKQVNADDIKKLSVEWNAEIPDPNNPGSKVTALQRAIFTRETHGEEMFALAAAKKVEHRANILYY